MRRFRPKRQLDREGLINVIAGERRLTQESSILALACALAIALVAAGCGGRGDGDELASGDGREGPAVPVEVAEVTARDLPLRVTAAARIEGLVEATVSAQVSAVVRGLPVALGDEVAEGDPLLILDDRDARAALLAARGGDLAATASLAQARQDFARAEELHRRGDISDTELETQRLLMEVARADSFAAASALLRAELELERTRVPNPVRSLVADILVELGALVNPGQPVAAIVSLDTVMVTLGLSEDEVALVKAGDEADLTTASLPGAVFPGRVTAVSPRAREGVRTYPVEIMFPNRRRILLPGMVARVSIEAGVEEDRLIIPIGSVLEEYGEDVVYVARENRAERRVVRLGEHLGGDVVVEDGLVSGDRLIVLGHANLKDGRRVELRRQGEPEHRQDGGGD